MHARVTRWEGAKADEIRTLAEQINSSDGPPPGVPAKGIMLLADHENGRSITVVLFETEDDLRQGDETLSAMNPDPGFSGQRTSLELYEVAVDRRV
jgi:hypothetical protein